VGQRDILLEDLRRNALIRGMNSQVSSLAVQKEKANTVRVKPGGQLASY
jgi:hypothetical protein